MSFSFGPKGGIQDPVILRLMAELTTLVKAHGSQSEQVEAFIKQHEHVVAVDDHSQHMHTFREIAEPMAMLIGGIRNSAADQVPGDSWQGGDAERIFDDYDPDEPADYWKR